MKPRHRSSTRLAALFWALGTALACARPAEALEHSSAVGDIAFSVFAPDWTWQNRAVNVMFVLKNQGARDAEVTIALRLPEGKEADFKADSGNLATTVSVPAGATVRAALTDILARSGPPRQVYPCALSVGSGESAAEVPYPLRTIRGAVVSSARWAMYLPVAMTLCWAIVIAVVMTLLTSRRAWLEPAAPISEPNERPAWIDETPK